MKDKCIVFGAGGLFDRYVSCIEKKYDILAVADNSVEIQGKEKFGHRIIPPKRILEFKYDTVIICSSRAEEIQTQLLEMGISHIYIFVPPGLLCDYGISETAKEIRFNEKPYKKNDADFHVLFTQISPCARTNRFAELLTNKGIKCSLAYMGVWGKENEKATGYYESIVHFFSYNDLIDYVRLSEYDLIHCSNEPDILTCLLLDVGKPIVHDCHDYLTLRDKLTPEMMALEFIANSRSNGCVYPSNGYMQIALDRYHLNKSKAIYMENFPSKYSLPAIQLQKLSSADGQIHCVYEGAITDNPDSYRYFEEQWLKLAAVGIHVHFYTSFQEDYCRKLDSQSDYIHYEGNLDIYTLLKALTQYDVGLCTFVENPIHKLKLDIASPNKMYEYLAAGLPLAASDHSPYRELFKKHRVGRVIDWNEDIEEQIKEISQITIPENFIIENRFTMEDEADKLISFYKKVINDFN